jgi:predicted RNA-binding Zn-ribbon protein involved in translation (DUF1610 family)
MTAKIFLFDIETSPMTSYAWDLWQEIRSFDFVQEDWKMLSWCGKWLGEDDIFFAANDSEDPLNDDETVLALHTALDEADIVIAHNGNKFDVKKFNARCLMLGYEPPSPYRKIDTLLEARKNFKMTSNRLDALGKLLGVGEKVDTGGFDLWVRFMAGDPAAREEMLEYNAQDVLLLEEVYLKLRPWMQNHPHVGLYDEEEQHTCPKCGGTDLHWRGYAYTATQKYHRFQCQDCGGWGRGNATALSKEKRGSLLRNVQ